MCGFFRGGGAGFLFFYLFLSVQHPAVLGGTFAENILKIEAWKPICQVEVCRRQNPGNSDTKLGWELSYPTRLIMLEGPTDCWEGLGDSAHMA